MSRWKLTGIFTAGVVVGVALALLAAPVWRVVLMYTYADEYRELVAECDGAMRQHLIAKRQALDDEEPPDDEESGEGSLPAVENAEIGLIACQDYDLLQKHLLLWGLRENELSILRLEAIESDPKGLADVVTTHEFHY